MNREVLFRALKEFVDREPKKVDALLAELDRDLAERRRVAKLWELPRANSSRTEDVN